MPHPSRVSTSSTLSMAALPRVVTKISSTTPCICYPLPDLMVTCFGTVTGGDPLEAPLLRVGDLRCVAIGIGAQVVPVPVMVRLVAKVVGRVRDSGLRMVRGPSLRGGPLVAVAEHEAR